MLGTEVDGLQVQKANAESVIEKAKVAEREIEKERAKIEKEWEDVREAVKAIA